MSLFRSKISYSTIGLRIEHTHLSIYTYISILLFAIELISNIVGKELYMFSKKKTVWIQTQRNNYKTVQKYMFKKKINK